MGTQLTLTTVAAVVVLRTIITTEAVGITRTEVHGSSVVGRVVEAGGTRVPVSSTSSVPVTARVSDP